VTPPPPSMTAATMAAMILRKGLLCGMLVLLFSGAQAGR
jgi:hypothetical protein